MIHDSERIWQQAMTLKKKSVDLSKFRNVSLQIELLGQYTLSNLKIAHVEPISSRISGSSTFDRVQLFRRVVVEF